MVVQVTLVFNLFVLYLLFRHQDPIRAVPIALVVCVLEISLWFSYRIIIYPQYVSPFRHLPEPPGSRFITGQTRSIPINPDVHIVRRWINDIPNDGFIRYRTIWAPDSVMITSPDLLQELLNANSNNFHKRPLLAKVASVVLGNGLVFAEGAEHKKQRKHLMPPFTFSQVKNLYPVFWRHAVSTTSAIKADMEITARENKSKDGVYTCNIGDWANRVTLDIIGDAGMGQSFNAIENPNNDLYAAYCTFFHSSRVPLVFSLIRIAVHNIVISRAPYLAQFFLPDPNNPVIKALRFIRGTCKEVIREGRSCIEARKLLSLGGISTFEIPKSRLPNKENVIRTAISSNVFTEEELVNQVMTFLLAGHETSAGTLTMAIYYLCKFPDVQKQLREEIRSYLPRTFDQDAITAEKFRSMPYLQAVREEVLRLAPALPVAGRRAMADTYVGSQLIPKGSTVLIAIAAINCSKAIWGEDALDFNPERWMQPGRVPTSPYANMTFLHGPRSCIGKEFANGTFLSLIVAMVSRFEFELEDPGFELKFVPMSISLKVEGGIRVRMRELEGY